MLLSGNKMFEERLRLVPVRDFNKRKKLDYQANSLLLICFYWFGLGLLALMEGNLNATAHSNIYD